MIIIIIHLGETVVRDIFMAHFGSCFLKQCRIIRIDQLTVV